MIIGTVPLIIRVIIGTVPLITDLTEEHLTIHQYIQSLTSAYPSLNLLKRWSQK